MNEVISEGWLSRIGNSIKGIFIGLALALVAVILLVANERNAVRDIRANKEIGKEVVSVTNDKVDSSKQGQLIHLNGPTKTDDIVQNTQFGISENAIRLSWQSEIYQWEETRHTDSNKNTGGSKSTTYTYSHEKKWVSEAIDSGNFEEPAGHTNNSEQKFESGLSQAQHVTVGAFTLPDTLITKITSSEAYPLQKIPAELANETNNIAAGAFYTGDSTSPAIGDEKVTFSLTNPGDVSVMAVQSNDSFEPYTAKNGKKRFILIEGLLSAEEVVKAEEKKAKILRWAGRIGGFVLMFIGFGLVLKPLSVFADVLPFFGNLVGAATGFVAAFFAAGISLIIIAIFWITFRPLIGVPILIIAGATIFFAIKKLTAKTA